MPTGTRLGDFVVTGVIRRGEFGIVYIGSDCSSQRNVAIKEYLPATLADRIADSKVVVRTLRHQQSFREGMQGFLSEARLLAGLDEPALVKVLQSWEQHGTAYIAMPLYEGRTLKDALRDSPSPNEAQLKTLLSPLLDALATLHGSGYFPCDVTPDNILVLSDGAPLLFDLGIARRIVARNTEDVTVVLKPGFAPIEQYAHDSSIPEGAWTDIYALAAVIYLAITGRQPTRSTSRIVSDTMQPLREVTKDYSGEFLNGVDRGLAVRPEHRPQTIAEFRAALGIFPGAVPLGRPAPAPSPSAVGPETLKVSPSLQPIPNPHAGSPARSRTRVLGDGSKLTPIPPPPENRLASPPARAVTEGRVGSARWKLSLSLGTAGLLLIGILLWILGWPGRAPPRVADNSSSIEPARSSAQPSPPSATSAQPTQTAAPPMTAPEVAPARAPSTQVAPSGAEGSSSSLPMAPPEQQRNVVPSVPNSNYPGAANPSVVGATSPSREGERRLASVPGAAAPTAPVPPALKTGKVQFSIKPWGEIVVDGKSHGMSPPVKVLSIPEGRHRIEIRNSTFPGYSSELDIKAGSSISIAHSFNAP